MATILKVILFVFAGISLVAALSMLLTGMRSRSAANSQFFNVGRLEARRKVFSSMLSTVGLVILALIFLGGALAVPDDLWESEPVVDEAPVDLVAEPGDEEPVLELDAVDTNEEPVESEPVVEVQVESPTLTPTVTETPEPTPTPKQEFIYVDSPVVGLYMRDLPEGDIIDVLDDRSRLSLKGENQIVNEINWILVLTDDGREGWVAEQFTTETLPALIEPIPEGSSDN